MGIDELPAEAPAKLVDQRRIEDVGVSQRDDLISIVEIVGAPKPDLVLGNVGIDRRSPDYFAMNVMNQVLGAGSSARPVGVELDLRVRG